MYNMDITGTKWTIFTTAVDQFAEKGYTNVSVRDIANLVKIKSSSIYYYFESKEKLLETLYEFYDYYYSYFMPALEPLLLSVGKEPPKAILKKMLFQFDPSIQDIMDKIVLIASTQLYNDERAQDLIYKNLFELSETRTRAVLNRMIEVKAIKPFDVDSFILLITSFCHSASLRMCTKFPIEWDTWTKGVDTIYQQIEEI